MRSGPRMPRTRRCATSRGALSSRRRTISNRPDCYPPSSNRDRFGVACQLLHNLLARQLAHITPCTGLSCAETTDFCASGPGGPPPDTLLTSRAPARVRPPALLSWHLLGKQEALPSGCLLALFHGPPWDVTKLTPSP